MVKKTSLKLLMVSLVVMGCTYGFTSCSDDDDKKPTLEDVNGDYQGTMAYATGDATIEATVKTDSVYFADFPVSNIVGFFVEGEMLEIIQAILASQKIAYTIGYTGAFDATKENIAMTFNPKPLELTIPLGEDVVQTIKVAVSATEKGNYSIANKKLTFGIKVTGVEVNGTALPNISEFGFDFNLNKK